MSLLERHRAALGITPRRIADDEIVDRLVLALVNEGARILDEGKAIRASDIDVVWVRLAFVLLVFTTGVWFFAWLAMLIVMPAARTPEQVASARGEALSAREVMDLAKRKSADLGKAAASGLRDAQRNLRETFGAGR